MVRKIKDKSIKIRIKESAYSELNYNKLNQETKDSLEEAHRIVHDSSIKLYKNLDDFWKDVLDK